MTQDTSTRVQCIDCPRTFVSEPSKTGPKSKRCPICQAPRGRTVAIASFFTCQYCALIYEKPGKRGPMPVTCEHCRDLHNEGRREILLENGRRSYWKNREKRLAEQATWKAANPDYQKERHRRDPDRPRRWRQAHPDWWPRYYESNRERITARIADYCRANPEVVRRKTEKRNQRKRCGPDAEYVDRIEVFERDGWTCGICKDPVDPDLIWPDPDCAELDHIVPLALDGAHSYANTQCSHRRCNAKKGVKLLPLEVISDGDVDVAS